jgi:hypothetical protein
LESEEYEAIADRDDCCHGRLQDEPEIHWSAGLLDQVMPEALEGSECDPMPQYTRDDQYNGDGDD